MSEHGGGLLSRRFWNDGYWVWGFLSRGVFGSVQFRRTRAFWSTVV
jgi:hypothetical protein